VRSGARASMPGMMDTILNLGLNDETAKGLAQVSGNERFAYDSYRRFVAMYGDVVLDMKPERKEDHDPFESFSRPRRRLGRQVDSELPASDLKELVKSSRPRSSAARASTSRPTPSTSSGAPSWRCSVPGRTTAPTPTAS
jgi:phosphoenolpyruvate synthase/pyruvate phosphate dikinase